MERITLGRTGIEVYRLGFGGIPIQRLDEAAAVAVVAHALEAGVDFIDTSRAYTTSEHRIGLAINQTGRRPVLATKSHQQTADGISADIELSLKELQVEYIDIYQCHFVRDEEAYRRILAADGAFAGLQQAREQGLINYIGISSHNLALLDLVVEEGIFDTMMVCYSFLEPAAGEHLIPKARERNIGVIAMKPFSGGVISDARLALKYALSQPGTLVIPGVEEENLFDENWRVFQQGDYSLTEAEWAEIRAIRQEFDRSFCRRCDYCQPCSEDIPIQTVLGLPSIIKRMGKAGLERDFVRDAVDKAQRCSECGECMERCPYGLAIPQLIKERLQWLATQQLS